MNENPHWSNTLNEDNDMSKFLKPEIKNKRSQDLKNITILTELYIFVELICC